MTALWALHRTLSHVLPPPPCPLTTAPGLPAGVRLADTGTDFAWAWNAPLMQFGGRGGLLLTSGRCVGTFTVGLLLALLLHRWPFPVAPAFLKEATRRLIAKILLMVTLSWSSFVYLLLTALMWPQGRPSVPTPDPAPASLESAPAAAPVDAAAAAWAQERATMSG